MPSKRLLAEIDKRISANNLRGIRITRSGKYEVRVWDKINKKKISLGTYSTLEEATRIKILSEIKLKIFSPPKIVKSLKIQKQPKLILTQKEYKKDARSLFRAAKLFKKGTSLYNSAKIMQVNLDKLIKFMLKRSFKRKLIQSYRIEFKRNYAKGCFEYSPDNEIESEIQKTKYRLMCEFKRDAARPVVLKSGR